MVDTDDELGHVGVRCVSGARVLSPGAKGATDGVWAEQRQIGVVFPKSLRRTEL